MVNLAFIIHAFMLFISRALLLTIIFLIFKNLDKFKKMDTFKIVVFLTSLIIAINTHEVVYYNFLKVFNIKPTIY
jgi:hypothetical protein